MYFRKGERLTIRLMFPCVVPTVLLTALLPAQAASYRYLGHHFTTVMSPYTTDDSVSGSFNTSGPLEANRPLSPVTLTSFSFSDGIQILTNLNATPLVFEISTDGSGNIEWWVIQLTANSCLSADACGIVTVHTVLSGDGGQIIPPTAAMVQGYVKDKPGAWTADTNPNTLPLGP
jgi:hypothetical protein